MSAFLQETTVTIFVGGVAIAWCCWVISYPVLGNTYYFNYAYDTEEQAITVCNTMNEHRATGNYDAKGHKIDTLTDLAFNFVLASKVAFLQKRTNQKRNWYLAR